MSSWLQYDWVCDDAEKLPLAQAVFFIGSIVGGIMSGYIADRFGRIPALVMCNLISAVAGIITTFSPANFAIFAFLDSSWESALIIASFWSTIWCWNTSDQSTDRFWVTYRFLCSLRLERLFYHRSLRVLATGESSVWQRQSQCCLHHLLH